MKADRSRDTFDPSKHYRRVLEQQGRVVIDADANEQTSIGLRTSETTNYDVIGPAGVPETTLAFGYNGGFEIGIGANEHDLTIAHGRIYAGGLLIENDADTTLATQPFLHWNAADLSATGVTGAGLYGVYLDAWERVITAIDDPLIRETALGGPDTSLRTQIAWQVKLGQIDTTEFGDNPPCAQILDPWNPNTDPGSLAAQGGAPSSDPAPCVLPPQSGFTALENQLYRVEIHTPGRYGTATFKWSRENGSVVYGITSQLSGSFSSPTFQVQSAGRDASLSVVHGDWVELIDDRSELTAGVGQLLQVDQVPDQTTISLQASPSLTVDATLHPKLRRWDQSANATATGVLIADGGWIDLENGVQVQFSDHFYEVGDYWLIPARTATAEQQVGTVEWPLDPATNQPAFEPPRGVQHYYAKLAIVAYDGTSFSPPKGSSAVTDCRLFFPPLTDVHPQTGPCTLVLQPGTNWAAPLAALFNDANARIDAELCFPVGEFPTAQAVEIATRGSVKVSGAGWGTKLLGNGVETVLRFKGCASVSVCDLAATATRVDVPADDPLKGEGKHINGALEFEDCAEVRVEGVSLRCAAGARRGAACLTVRSAITAANAATGAGTARVYDSSFAVGELQYGILLVHQARAFVERNEIAVVDVQKRRFVDQLNDPVFVKSVERVLLHRVQVSPASSSSSASASSSSSASSASHSSSSSSSTAPGKPSSSSSSSAPQQPGGAAVPPRAAGTAAFAAAPAPIAERSAAGIGMTNQPVLPISRAGAVAGNASVSFKGRSISFNTPGPLKDVFQVVVDRAAPQEFASNVDLLKFVRSSLRTVLTDPKARASFSGLVNMTHFFEQNDVAVGMRGIAVGGRGLGELRIRDNVIEGMMQGIVVGLSRRERKPPGLPADVAGTVTIAGNTVHVAYNPVRGYVHARYGIFAGNVESLQIENNDVTVRRLATLELPCDGIRVFGYLGRKAILRHNHVRTFARGAVVVALQGPGNDLSVPTAYSVQTQSGNLWLIADNVFENVSIAIVTQCCMEVGNMIWRTGDVGSAP